MSFVWGIC